MKTSSAVRRRRRETAVNRTRATQLIRPAVFGRSRPFSRLSSPLTAPSAHASYPQAAQLPRRPARPTAAPPPLLLVASCLVLPLPHPPFPTTRAPSPPEADCPRPSCRVTHNEPLPREPHSEASSTPCSHSSTRQTRSTVVLTHRSCSSPLPPLLLLPF